MFAAPAEGTLKNFMEFAETGFADHEQSPPNQRTHATEHYAELINRNRRYGRLRHASSLPKPTRTPSNLTPGISRSPLWVEMFNLINIELSRSPRARVS
jgi:hypothetical protein